MTEPCSFFIITLVEQRRADDVHDSAEKLLLLCYLEEKKQPLGCFHLLLLCIWRATSVINIYYFVRNQPQS